MKHHLFSHNRILTLVRIVLGMFALFFTILSFIEPSVTPFALAQIAVLSPQEALKQAVQQAKAGASTTNTFVKSGDPWIDITNYIGRLIGPNVTFWKSWRDGSKRATGYINPTALLSFYAKHPDDPTKEIVTMGTATNAKGELVTLEWSGKPMLSFLDTPYRRLLDFFGAFRELIRLNGKNAPEFSVRKSENGRAVTTTIRYYDLQSDGTIGFIEADKAVGNISGGIITDRLSLDIPRRGGYGYGAGNMGGDGLRAFANPQAGAEQQAMQNAMNYDTSALAGLTL